MRLVLPVPPSWNRAYRAGQGRFYTPESIIAFRTEVRVAAKNARIKMFPAETRVSVSLWWFRRQQAGDLDKRVSVLLDALQGVWFVNDRQVSEIHAYRDEDKHRPRLEVEVVAVTKDQEKAA